MVRLSGNSVGKRVFSTLSQESANSMVFKDMFLGKMGIKSMPFFKDFFLQHARTTLGYPEALMESGKMGKEINANNNNANRDKKAMITNAMKQHLLCARQGDMISMSYEKTEVLTQKA